MASRTKWLCCIFVLLPVAVHSQDYYVKTIHDESDSEQLFFLAQSPSDSKVFVSDSTHHCIRVLDLKSGEERTYAGECTEYGHRDDRRPSSARFDTPRGMCLDSRENLYVVDAGNMAIRKISKHGAVSTIAGIPGEFGSRDGEEGTFTCGIWDIECLDDGSLVVTDLDEGKVRLVECAGECPRKQNECINSEMTSDVLYLALAFFGGVAVLWVVEEVTPWDLHPFKSKASRAKKPKENQNGSLNDAFMDSHWEGWHVDQAKTAASILHELEVSPTPLQVSPAVDLDVELPIGSKQTETGLAHDSWEDFSMDSDMLYDSPRSQPTIDDTVDEIIVPASPPDTVYGGSPATARPRYLSIDTGDRSNGTVVTFSTEPDLSSCSTPTLSPDSSVSVRNRDLPKSLCQTQQSQSETASDHPELTESDQNDVTLFEDGDLVKEYSLLAWQSEKILKEGLLPLDSPFTSMPGGDMRIVANFVSAQPLNMHVASTSSVSEIEPDSSQSVALQESSTPPLKCNVGNELSLEMDHSFSLADILEGEGNGASEREEESEEDTGDESDEEVKPLMPTKDDIRQNKESDQNRKEPVEPALVFSEDYGYSASSHWLVSLFSIRGRNLPFALLFLLFFYVTACIAVAMHFFTDTFHNTPWWPEPQTKKSVLSYMVTPVSVVGMSLFFFESSKTNRSYERHKEGFKVWVEVLDRSLTLGRLTCAYVTNLEAADLMMRWTVAIPATLIMHIRLERSLPILEDVLPESDIYDIVHAPNPLIHVTIFMTTLIQALKRRNLIDGRQVPAFEAAINHIVEKMGDMERLSDTPFPFAYTAHARLFMVVWLMVVPFSLLQSMGWTALPTSLLMTLSAVGVEAASAAMENPFGMDPSDIPLERMAVACKTTLLYMLKAARQLDRIVDGIDKDANARRLNRFNLSSQDFTILTIQETAGERWGQAVERSRSRKKWAGGIVSLRENLTKHFVSQKLETPISGDVPRGLEDESQSSMPGTITGRLFEQSMKATLKDDSKKQGDPFKTLSRIGLSEMQKGHQKRHLSRDTAYLGSGSRRDEPLEVLSSMTFSGNQSMRLMSGASLDFEEGRPAALFEELAKPTLDDDSRKQEDFLRTLSKRGLSEMQKGHQKRHLSRDTAYAGSGGRRDDPLEVLSSMTLSGILKGPTRGQTSMPTSDLGGTVTKSTTRRKRRSKMKRKHANKDENTEETKEQGDAEDVEEQPVDKEFTEAEEVGSANDLEEGGSGGEHAALSKEADTLTEQETAECGSVVEGESANEGNEDIEESADDTNDEMQ